MRGCLLWENCGLRSSRSRTSNLKPMSQSGVGECWTEIASVSDQGSQTHAPVWVGDFCFFLLKTKTGKIKKQKYEKTNHAKYICETFLRHFDLTLAKHALRHVFCFLLHFKGFCGKCLSDQSGTLQP